MPGKKLGPYNLKDYQQNIVDFIERDIDKQTASPHGLLLCHSVGLGKTVTALAAAAKILQMQTSPDHMLGIDQVQVVSPTSVKKQWESYLDIIPELKDYHDQGRLSFFTHNKWLKTQAPDDNDKTIQRTMVIIDEAHLFGPAPEYTPIRASLNNRNRKHELVCKKGGVTADKFISLINHAKYALLLTATPMTNSIRDLLPFVAGLCFRQTDMARAYISNKLSLLSKKSADNHEYIYRSIVNDLRNYVSFVYRSRGHTAGSGSRDTQDPSVGLPAVSEYIVDLYMSKNDARTYLRDSNNLRAIYKLEDMTNGILNRGIPKVSQTDASGTSAFFMKLRALSNQLRAKQKWLKVHLNDWLKKRNEKVLVFSNFVEHGKDIVESILKKLSERHHRKELSKNRSKDPFGYAVIQGDVPSAKRKAIIDKFNKGTDINTLIITAAGAEGIDLKGVNHVVILEPYWQLTQLIQVVGRAARTGSHAHLPPDKQFVNVYNLVLHPPAQLPGNSIKITKSIDEQVYRHAHSKESVIQHLYNMLYSVSIENVSKQYMAPDSPPYVPTSPAYKPTNNGRALRNSPDYEPWSPPYQPTSPAYKPINNRRAPKSPAYEPWSPDYVPTSPAYQATSPAYQPTNNGPPVLPPEGYQRVRPQQTYTMGFEASNFSNLNKSNDNNNKHNKNHANSRGDTRKQNHEQWLTVSDILTHDKRLVEQVNQFKGVLSSKTGLDYDRLTSPESMQVHLGLLAVGSSNKGRRPRPQVDTVMAANMIRAFIRNTLMDLRIVPNPPDLVMMNTQIPTYIYTIIDQLYFGGLFFKTFPHLVVRNEDNGHKKRDASVKRKNGNVYLDINPTEILRYTYQKQKLQTNKNIQAGITWPSVGTFRLRDALDYLILLVEHEMCHILDDVFAPVWQKGRQHHGAPFNHNVKVLFGHKFYKVTQHNHDENVNLSMGYNMPHYIKEFGRKAGRKPSTAR